MIRSEQHMSWWPPPHPHKPTGGGWVSPVEIFKLSYIPVPDTIFAVTFHFCVTGDKVLNFSFSKSQLYACPLNRDNFLSRSWTILCTVNYKYNWIPSLVWEVKYFLVDDNTDIQYVSEAQTAGSTVLLGLRVLLNSPMVTVCQPWDLIQQSTDYKQRATHSPKIYAVYTVYSGRGVHIFYWDNCIHIVRLPGIQTVDESVVIFSKLLVWYYI